jgi:hypothetical protein
VTVTPEQRAAFRAFVRAHHPDIGGDPETFRAGLAAFGLRPGEQPGVVPADDPRLDAPITAVRGGALHRIGRAGRRLVRRYDPRSGSARVV